VSCAPNDGTTQGMEKKGGDRREQPILWSQGRKGFGHQKTARGVLEGGECAKKERKEGTHQKKKKKKEKNSPLLKAIQVWERGGGEGEKSQYLSQQKKGDSLPWDRKPALGTTIERGAGEGRVVPQRGNKKKIHPLAIEGAA